MRGLYWFDFGGGVVPTALLLTSNPYLMPDTSFDKYDEPALHMKRLMNAHLVELDIPLRILIPLESAGIRRIGDLVSRDKESLLSIPQIGRGAFNVIQSTLDRFGLSLGMNKKGCLPTAR